MIYISFSIIGLYIFLTPTYFRQTYFLTRSNFLFSWYHVIVNGKHRRSTLYINNCTDILYYCRQLAQMDCSFVYTTVHWCSTLHYLNTLVLHTLLYVYTVVQCTPVLILTEDSPSKITFMNSIDQTQLRFLSLLLLSCCMLATALLPLRMGRGKNMLCLLFNIICI
jgi:hypothetical protein